MDKTKDIFDVNGARIDFSDLVKTWEKIEKDYKEKHLKTEGYATMISAIEAIKVTKEVQKEQENDSYEQEADSVGRQIVSGING